MPGSDFLRRRSGVVLGLLETLVGMMLCWPDVLSLDVVKQGPLGEVSSEGAHLRGDGEGDATVALILALIRFRKSPPSYQSSDKTQLTFELDVLLRDEVEICLQAHIERETLASWQHLY